MTTEIQSSSPPVPSSPASPIQSPEYNLTPHLMGALIESANDAVISKTLDGTITSWNKGAERIFGYKPEEIIGKSVLTLIPPDRHGEEAEIIARLKAGERIEHYETVRVRKDGSPVDISLTISPIKGVDGDIIGASKIAHEMTEIKQAERQLRATQERYRALFDSIDEGFCVIQMIFDENGKAIDYRFLEVNPAFERQTGLLNALGKTMREFIPNHDESWFEIYGRVALTGEPIRFENRAEVMDSWFDLYAFRAGKPEEHKVAVIFSNITERKRTEHENQELLNQLKAERAKLAYLFDKAPAFVATLQGPQHVFELTNPAYRQLIGHRDVVGKPVLEALPEIAEQGFLELLDRVYQSGEAYNGREIPIELQHEPDGPLEERFLDFVYQPLFDANGEVNGIFVHGIDITEQVLARREAENANRLKDEFLATLSHELRTPLNAILGWARLLSDGELDAANRSRAVDVIQRNAQLQAQLIEDILDVSRIITGKLRLEVRPTEVAAVVEAAIESVLPAAQAKEIRLQRVLDSGPSLVSGDPDRLQQVIWNLLSNAIKFTPKGRRVQVRLERVNSHVEIIVADKGIGIPPEVIPYVFDRFRQADATSTRQYGGLGLGLAIVRHIVEMHGGTVEVESAGKDEGATFTVRLPLLALRSIDVVPDRRQKREHPTAGTTVAFDCPPELKGLKVLVVDDEEDARRLVSTVLEKCGTRVTAVPSVREALEVIPALLPDVLISDLGMPGEDGYSLIEKVRALSSAQGGQTPAAALTAYARVEDRMRILRAGFQIHLPKPVEPAELVAVVANLSKRHELN